MKFNYINQNGVAIVRLSGSLSHSKDRDRVLRFYETLGTHPRHVILNLQKIKIVSSWILAISFSLHQLLKDYNKKILLVKHTDDIRLILIVAGLENKVLVFKSEADAMKAAKEMK